jgi:hypothetical protein
MSRKSKVVTIETEGRDQGKSFRIQEMPAMSAERWAMRAFHAVMKAGGEAEGYTAGGGWEQLAMAGYGVFSRIDPDTAQPLWDELLTCVTRVEDVNRPEVFRPLVVSDIDEVSTIIQLKLEAFSIHANFSTAGAGLTSTPAQMTSRAPSSPSTPTSQPASGPSFHRSSRPSPRSRKASA